MGKIFIILGKSATGKDTIYKGLLENKELNLKTVVMYTTRPIRVSESNGVEYYFVSDQELQQLIKEERVIEHRAYDTVHGVWNYFTVNDEQIDINNGNYLMLGTLESLQQIRAYFGDDKVVPIYIEVEDGIRLSRALSREMKQSEPKYAELCRRFLADSKDFSEENISRLQIAKRYQNTDLEICLKQIERDIKKSL